MIALRIKIPSECPDCGQPLEHHDGRGNTCPCEAVLCKHCELFWNDSKFEVNEDGEYIHDDIRQRFEVEQ